MACVLALWACGDDAIAPTPDGATDAPRDGMATGPILAVDTTSLDFGVVGVGDSSTATVTVTNSGDEASGPLTTSIVGPDGSQFEVTTPCGVVAPGGSCTLQVLTRVTRAGSSTATLRIVASGVVIDVSLETLGTNVDNILVMTPALYQLEVLVGEASSPTPFYVTNVGTTTHGPLVVTVSGENANEVTVTNDTCTDALLAGGDVCTFDVIVRPLFAGTREAIVEVAGGVPSPLMAPITTTAISPPGGRVRAP